MELNALILRNNNDIIIILINVAVVLHVNKLFLAKFANHMCKCLAIFYNELWLQYTNNLISKIKPISFKNVSIIVIIFTNVFKIFSCNSLIISYIKCIYLYTISALTEVRFN